MSTNIRDHVTQRSTWLRFLYMCLYGVIFNVLQIIIMLTVILQFIIKLLTGKGNSQLSWFGDGLAAYVYEIIRFLTFATESLPFPFAPWPGTSRITGDGSRPDHI